jgi:PQQ-like domain
MRGRSLLVVLSLSLSATPARAAEEPRSLFSFSASATLFARPGVGPSGSVYVGSGDGSVHALRADGGYRWSYTVQGRVAAPPVEEPRTGRVFVVTSEKRLYALEASSQLRWVFSLPAAPESELLLTPQGTLLFVGEDAHLYGVTTGGGLNLRLAASGARSAPVWLASGQAALVLGENIGALKGYGYERTPLGLVFGDSAKLALGADRAVFSCEEGTARVNGAEGPGLSSDCLSPPVAGDGFVAIAEARAVRLVTSKGASQRWELGAVPLRPIWDGARRRLILSTATGEVTVLELPR